MNWCNFKTNGNIKSFINLIFFLILLYSSLPSGIHVGRAHVKTVAERRVREIRLFLVSLFNSSEELAHSSLVYTFFHPLLRDQQERDINAKKVKGKFHCLLIISNEQTSFYTFLFSEPKAINTDRVSGEVKFSIQYSRGALTVMVSQLSIVYSPTLKSIYGS